MAKRQRQLPNPSVALSVLASPIPPHVATRMPAKLVLPDGLDHVDKEKVIVILLFMLEGATGMMLSGDAWYLAYMSAQVKCKEVGISEKDFKAVCATFNKLRVDKKRRNPFASMFDGE